MRLLLWFTFTLAVRISPSWSSKCGASQREVALSNPVMSSLAVCYPDLFRVLELAFTMPLSKLISCTHSSQNKLDRCLYHDLHCWIWVTNTVLALSEISRCLIFQSQTQFMDLRNRQTHSMPVICACSSLHVAAVEHDVFVLLAVLVLIWPVMTLRVMTLFMCCMCISETSYCRPQITFVCWQVDAWIDDAISC